MPWAALLMEEVLNRLKTARVLGFASVYGPEEAQDSFRPPYDTNATSVMQDF